MLNTNTLKIDSDFKERLLHMVETEFPELVITEFPRDYDEFLDERTVVSIGDIDVMVIYGESRFLMVIEQLEFHSAEKYRTNNGGDVTKSTPPIVSTGVMRRKMDTVDEYRIHLKRLVKQYNQLVKEEKEIEERNELERIEKDFR